MKMTINSIRIRFDLVLGHIINLRFDLVLGHIINHGLPDALMMMMMIMMMMIGNDCRLMTKMKAKQTQI